MVKVRFGLVTYVEEDVTVSLVGSVKELGRWDLSKSVPLHPAVPPETTAEPSFWVCDVELYKGTEPAVFQYKFVRRATGGGEGGDWEWEGSGPAHNRWWIPEEEEKNMVGNGVYLTPVAMWKEADGDPHTLEHTASFYYTICDSRTMHYSEVVENLWVGSCPRIPAHITHGMKTALGITAVINLQREEDVCTDSAGCCPEVPSTDVPDNLSQLYKDHDISYIWIPANDWDPKSKVGVLPAAVYKLWELLKSGHHVYVYCNAGIIRSVLIVCGYLYYVLGWPYRVMEYHVCSQRPVACVDQGIILEAEKEFQEKFGSDVLAARCAESPRSYQPQPPPKIPVIQATQTEQQPNEEDEDPASPQPPQEIPAIQATHIEQQPSDGGEQIVAVEDPSSAQAPQEIPAIQATQTEQQTNEEEGQIADDDENPTSAQPPQEIPAITATQTEEQTSKDDGQIVAEEDPSSAQPPQEIPAIPATQTEQQLNNGGEEIADDDEAHFVAKTKIVLRRTVDFPPEEGKELND